MILYIDPGTGSMLFAAILGVVSTIYFFVQKIIVTIKFSVFSRKDISDDSNKKDLILFSEGKQYWKVFKGICEELEKNKFQCEYWTMDREDPALKNDYNFVKCIFIGNGNKAFARLNTANAKRIISTTPGLDVYQWKKSPKVDEYIHIFHSIDEGVAYKMFGLDFYDTVFMVGDFQEHFIRKIEEIRNIEKKKLLVMGCTYMDELLKQKEDIKISEKSDSKMCVLLAPSWGSESLLSKYGDKIIKKLISSDYRLIIRPHPQSLKSEMDMIEGLMKKYPESDTVKWDMSPDNFNSLKESDVLISDFSSVVFDFSFIFERPVVYAKIELDLSKYDACWLDEPVWRFEVLPKIGISIEDDDVDKLEDEIAQIVKNKEFAEKRNEFKNQVWCNQGKSAELMAEYVMN
ncbi:MAG: CDP-glycerol glycerophosphotransferase family protein [Lachnospiraceae bacterium]|nr:CDP-glycerol glycerophosphotransferase family protein [Lachnospiraceae bacterium]